MVVRAEQPAGRLAAQSPRRLSQALHTSNEQQGTTDICLIQVASFAACPSPEAVQYYAIQYVQE